ncbi:hypothetical protein AB0368_19930 [Actinoplanes sp. NPDC051475]|uniref:hypothetical protein n=1 Tax=Actinoplanes sp. NPDC051475 TaxID=3157225 RepID=UPI00344EAB9E
MTTGPQAMFVVEYPCDRFCRIEVDLSGERGQVTLQQLREKAEGLHQRVHEPELAEAEAPAVEQEATGRPAATVFLSAPGRGTDRRR